MNMPKKVCAVENLNLLLIYKEIKQKVDSIKIMLFAIALALEKRLLSLFRDCMAVVTVVMNTILHQSLLRNFLNSECMKIRLCNTKIIILIGAISNQLQARFILERSFAFCLFLELSI